MHGLGHPSHSTAFTDHLGIYAHGTTAPEREGRGSRGGGQQSVTPSWEHSIALPGTHFIITIVVPLTEVPFARHSPLSCLPGAGQHTWGAEPLQP